jgi:hypothetical protein
MRGNKTIYSPEHIRTEAEKQGTSVSTSPERAHDGMRGSEFMR